MKELEQKIPHTERNNVSLSMKKQQEIENELIGKIIPKIGQFVWELNTITMECKKAEYKKDTFAILSAKLPPKELIRKPDCIYIPAMNIKNAIKKYNKNSNQSSYYVVEAPMSLTDMKF